MSRKERPVRRGGGPVNSTSVCYCDGSRRLGTLELLCTGCSKWFHGTCLKDLPDFYGLPFMICYVFHCHSCSPTKKETWLPKQANFIHMCVTVLANLTIEEHKKVAANVEDKLDKHYYFNLEGKIIPYFNENWVWLTSMPKRVKNTWHSTLHKTLTKELDLFKVDPNDENAFALIELDLSSISPVHEAVKQIGKKASATNNLTTTLVDQSKIEKLASEDGPKTRGASKRKVVDNSASSTSNKKPKTTADYSSARIGGNALIDIPFNKDGYRYYLVEKDDMVHDRNLTDEEEATTSRTIPGHLYRIAHQQFVTISPNDRAYQLRLSDDHLNITGHEGYCVARATHSVGAGKWYFEVQLKQSPPGSAVRVGWAQQYAAVQACVGYNKFSYGIRSIKGTKFHNAIGKTYYPKGFSAGDVIGCMISLPFNKYNPGTQSSKYLPNCGKDHVLIKFKGNYFYEEHEEPSTIVKTLEELPQSQIEFFHNGVSCGVAFTDIYRGFYFPAVSLFHQSTLRLNFGPNFTHPPRKGVKPMSERPNEMAVHQALSDIIYMVDKNLYRQS